jgi:hypothetical protein
VVLVEEYVQVHCKIGVRLKYFLWGISMLFHGIYMLISHKVSFGWDTIALKGTTLYLTVIPYMLFTIWVITLGLFKKN